jgi:hypothetical protein
MLGKCSSTEVLCYIIHLYWTGGVAQAAEYRPSSREAQSSNSVLSPPPKKKKEHCSLIMAAPFLTRGQRMVEQPLPSW